VHKDMCNIFAYCDRHTLCALKEGSCVMVKCVGLLPEQLSTVLF
jgi:hypothetical protein